MKWRGKEGQSRTNFQPLPEVTGCTLAFYSAHSFTHIVVRGSGGLKSCESLISRVELNDPTLKELVVLPMKTFGGSEVERLASILGKLKTGLLIWCI